jgi:CheY-like chemotaxis protein
MPGMDGYETIRAIRAIDRFKSLPIIAVTGKVMAGERQRCLEAGANDYVPKPDRHAQSSSPRSALAPGHGSAHGTRAGSHSRTSIDLTRLERSPSRVNCTWSPMRTITVHPEHPRRGIPSRASQGPAGRRRLPKHLRAVGPSRARTCRCHRGREWSGGHWPSWTGSPTIDVVLMDIMMPVMDGYESMRSIRAVAQFASLPIIAVTGKVVAGERQRCIEAGANDYVPKPVDTAELLAALRPWLDHRVPAALA